MDKRLIEEQLLALTEESVRRKEDDPLREFKRHKKQIEFSEDILFQRVREAWAVWANRTGKSQIGAYIDASLARFGWAKTPSNYQGSGDTLIEVRDKATSGWVVSQDFPASRDVMQPKIFDNGFVPPGAVRPLIPEREVKEWRVSDQVLKLKNGSIIGFKSCDSSVVKFASAGKDYIHFDEEPPKQIFDEATIRIEAGRRLQVFATCTLLPPPGEGGGVSWIFGERIKKWQNGTLDPQIKIYTASIYDNPFLGPDEIKFLESVYPEGSIMRRIRLDGELLPGMGGARAYPGFKGDIHVRNTQIDNRFPLAWIWDFNVEPMITHVGQRFGDTFYVHDQIFMESGSIPEMCDLFYDRFSDWPNDIIIYGDATGQNRTGQTGITDYAMIMNNLRNYRLYPRLRIPKVNPSISERLGAVNYAFKNEQGAANLIVNPKCDELIQDLEEVVMAPGGGIKKSHNSKDPYYKRTHASDGIGYWIVQEAPVRLHAKRRPAMLQDNIDIKRPGYWFN